MTEHLDFAEKRCADYISFNFSWYKQQIQNCINPRLELAGGIDSIFIPEAVREVHRYTKGIPRRINIACDQAMIAAFIEEMQTVDARYSGRPRAFGISPRSEVVCPPSRPRMPSSTGF
jgi:general secretion pathway protein A